MDGIVDLVQQLEPGTAPPSEAVKARQREALLQSMAKADDTRTRSGRRRPPRRSTWAVAIAAAAVAAAVVALVIPGSSLPPRRPAAESAVLTAITRALAGTDGDIEEVRSTMTTAVVRLSTTSWVDLSTGACRTDTSVNGTPSLTLSVARGKAVFIDYAARVWWTRPTGGVTCEPLTPQSIRSDLAAGHYVVVGHATLDGQRSLKLVSTTTTTGLHPVAKLSTLWVNAMTYLPIKSTSTGHLTELTTFTWLPAGPGSTRVLRMTPPVGFREVVAPRAQSGIVFGP